MTTESNNARDIVEVPLGNHATPARVFRHSLKELERAGVSFGWFIHNDGAGALYVKVQHQGKPVSVARLITRAGSREQVTFRSKNRLDLRTDNLKVTKIKA
jgi:hypothetical protein